jgi:hypothetical protein
MPKSCIGYHSNLLRAGCGSGTWTFMNMSFAGLSCVVVEPPMPVELSERPKVLAIGKPPPPPGPDTPSPDPPEPDDTEEDEK